MIPFLMRVLSFDPSTTSIGVSFIDTETRVILATSIFRGNSKTNKGEVFDRERQAPEMCRKVKEWLTKQNIKTPDNIIIEEAYLSFNRAIGKDTLIWFNGYFSSFVSFTYSTLPLRVHPMTWKSGLLGNKHAGKEETEEQVLEWISRNGFHLYCDQPKVDDSYDAVAIGLWRIKDLEPDRYLF